MFIPSKCRRLVLFALLLAGGRFGCAADPAPPEEAQIAIIASNLDSLPKIDEGSLREVYLKRIFLNSDGRPYIPVNLPATHPLRNAFVSTVLKMSTPQMQIYWDRRYFQGVNPPYVLGSQKAVVKFVAATPGAIGYVQLCHVTPEVHVILLVPLTGVATEDVPEKCPNSHDAAMSHVISSGRERISLSSANVAALPAAACAGRCRQSRPRRAPPGPSRQA